MYPTMVAMAGAPALNPAVNGEPALGGRSLVPVIEAALSGKSHSNSSVAFSQYSRRRCLNDYFYGPNKVDPRTGKVACALDAAGHFTGFSVRRNNGFDGTPADGLRYTRWVNVSQSGNAKWDEVVDEELYIEKAADCDNYDKSESYGNLARYSPVAAALVQGIQSVFRSPGRHKEELQAMRALLKSGFVPQ